MEKRTQANMNTQELPQEMLLVHIADQGVGLMEELNMT
jgi:hypothetical protein|uniref:Uncharacterized protein n=1 Tax=viral metagenome TaxID=1070528 RepID=A0A6C0I6J3_9ZZZZ